MIVQGSNARTRSRLGAIAAAAIAAVLLVGAAQAAAAPVFVGTSGWFWGNPLPQGEHLNAVDFSGSRGYAVGSSGLVLRSDDGGSTWTSLQANTSADLARVQIVDANTVIVGGGCTVRRSVDGGLTWTRLPFTASETNCNTPLAAFAFSSPTVGNIALLTGAIFHTDDGGETFSGRAPVPGGTPSDLQFTSATTGIAVVGQSIYRTVDAAASWQLVKTATGTFKAVDFPTATTGFAVGLNVFMRSDDGGATWNPQPLTGGGIPNFQDVSCATAMVCALTFPDSVSVARTTDGGATSSSVTTPAAGVLTSLSFAAGSRLVAVGSAGTTVVSNDAGVSFTAIGGRLEGFDTYALRLRSALGSRAYLTGGPGKFAQTTDGGRSWASVGVSTADVIVDLSFPAPGAGFALGSSGTLLRTDNGGSSWRILDTGGPALRVIALDGKRVAILGERGIRRSTNGLAFTATGSRTVRRTPFTALDLAGSAIVALNSKVAYLTRDGGGTWRKLKTPKVRIRELDFVSASRGFLLATNGKLYSTASGGRKWAELVALGGSFPEHVAFADAAHGFAIGDGTFRTNDGGRSWQGVPLGQRPDTQLAGVVAPTATTGMALTTSPLQIFATASGGAIGTPTTLTGKPSKRRLTKAGTVKFSGKLRPAVPGAIVTVDLRRGTKVATKRATVSASGSYSVTFKVRASSYVVAHWNGTGKFAGDGTLATKITVKPKRRGR